MKKTNVFLLALLLLPLLPGCHMACLTGHGPVRADDRTPAEFTGVHLDVPAEVTVRKGESCRVHIEAEDNLIDEIVTRNKGGVLRIGSDHCLDPQVPIRIEVTLPRLDELEINGSGKILVPDTFQVEALSLEINGAGDIRGRFVAAEVKSAIRGSGDIALTGSANHHKSTISGSGNVDAADLPCNSADIRVTGSGEIHAYVIQRLEVKVTGSGNVYYKGKPTVTTKVTGSGKVVDAN